MPWRRAKRPLPGRVDRISHELVWERVPAADPACARWTTALVVLALSLVPSVGLNLARRWTTPTLGSEEGMFVYYMYM